MTIRKAKLEDSKAVADYIMLAMEEIVYQFIGRDAKEEATQFMENLVRKTANPYSYENSWVVDIDGDIAAAGVVYDGAKMLELRKVVGQDIKAVFGEELYQRYINSEIETEAGEYYIDCVGVSPNHQGKGIGSKIFQFLIDEYVHNRKGILGLLVDKDNPNAKKLYLKLGFEIVGEKTLTGKEMEHLQFKA
ncbi:MAG: GNAT family N-acetyltransferase [Bacteroidales bacterium]|nr:GNAT family N-acetyltransferase [Bacteroidales bacterium]